MSNPNVKIQRHRTAMKRQGLSRPVRLAFETGLIGPRTSVFDYGCGRGDDLRGLEKLGIPCSGWDPVYRPDTKRQEADVVNLGYVVNVIENIQERADTLKKAFALARSLLVVSARLSLELRQRSYHRYCDGYVTQRDTFQKIFTQTELRDWINTTLSVCSVAAAPGIFFIFRDEGLRQHYLTSRYRRTPPPLAIPQPERTFERHRELLAPLLDFFERHGRLPHDSELQQPARLKRVFGSIQQAFAVVRKVLGTAQWDRIREERIQDMLVYLALERFGDRRRLSELPDDLQRDIKSLFKTYKQACDAADDLLFSAGDMQAVDAACKTASVGKLTPEALYVHTSGLLHLPLRLRVYEGCARSYLGTVEDANVIKLNRRKPQISYLSYPNFERKPHPELAGSLVVHLQTLQVSYRDYSQGDSPPILHRKETLVPADYPCRAKFERLTRQEEQWGLFDNPSTIGARDKWSQLLASKGIRLSGHRVIKL